MSEAEYAILDHLESVCRELRTMIRTTEKERCRTCSLAIWSVAYIRRWTALWLFATSTRAARKPQALKNWIIARLCDGDTVKAGAGI